LGEFNILSATLANYLMASTQEENYNACVLVEQCEYYLIELGKKLYSYFII